MFSGARIAGLNIGIYVYSYCNNLTALQSGTDWVINQLEKYKSWINLPVFLDLEDISITNLNKTELTKQGLEFCKIIEGKGYKAGVYANKYWWQNKLEAGKFLDFKIWVAQYANISQPSVNFRVDLWQYTSTGKVEGIKGNVDRNKCLNCENIGNIEDITGEMKGDYEVKKYINGSTQEDIYQDIECTKKIGYLFPHEECECFGIKDGVAILVYQINGGKNKKVGFAKWLGGIVE